MKKLVALLAVIILLVGCVTDGYDPAPTPEKPKKIYRLISVTKDSIKTIHENFK